MDTAFWNMSKENQVILEKVSSQFTALPNESFSALPCWISRSKSALEHYHSTIVTLLQFVKNIYNYLKVPIIAVHYYICLLIWLLSKSCSMCEVHFMCVGDWQLHPIGHDKTPALSNLAVIKGHIQMLLSDITRVKGYKWTLFTAWLTSRSDDPCSHLGGRPTSSPNDGSLH